MLSETSLLDDATRPRAPRIEGVTAEQRERGKHLAMIHAMHLEQLAETRRAMERVESGDAPAGAAGDAVASLDMTRNFRRFGNLCGHECRMLEFHHTAEDRYLFPILRDADPELRKVVERLSAEHEVIGSLLERLEVAAVDSMKTPGPDTFAPLKEAFLALERVVKSHFGYEQTELEEAIGYYGVPI